MPKPSKITIPLDITRQLAVRNALGASLRELEKEFGYSRPVIVRTLETDLAKGIIKEVADSAISGAVLAVKRQLADLTELAMAALKKNLEENSMEAVKTYFKALGIESSEKSSGSDPKQGITVIFPGQEAAKHVESSVEGAK